SDCEHLHKLYSVYFFFFSSRRRHTRSYGDWSSDVCSSDLQASRPVTGDPAGWEGIECVVIIVQRQTELLEVVSALGALGLLDRRSEERRVGKECRSRWGAEHERERGEERMDVMVLEVKR